MVIFLLYLSSYVMVNLNFVHTLILNLSFQRFLDLYIKPGILKAQLSQLLLKEINQYILTNQN